MKNTEAFANVAIFFKEGEYEKSIAGIPIITHLFNPEKKYLYKLKIANFFELKYTDEMFYSIDSFCHFLSNKNNLEYTKNDYKFINSIRAIQKDLDKKEELTSKKKEQILEDSKTSEFHWWFKKKIEEIA